MPPPSARAHELARVLAEYHLLHHGLEKADAIIVLGSNDPRVAERGAEVYHDGWAPLVVCTGNVGELTRNLYDQAEGRVFARICQARGVPAERIVVEDQATHSGENASFCRDLFAARGIEPRSLILVQKPYMERRAFATFRKVWPGPRLMVTSPQIPYEKYATADISAERIIHIIVGDLQRIALYPQLGYQVEQAIPAAVWDAFRELVAMGFTGHLVASGSPSPG